MVIETTGSRLRHPQTTVRWRLTLLYGGMFLVCGAVLLAITYALVSRGITGGSGVSIPPRAQGSGGATSTATYDTDLTRARQQFEATQHEASVTANAPPVAHTPFPAGRAGGPRFDGGAGTLPAPNLGMPPHVPPALQRILSSPAGQQFLALVQTQQRVDELNQLEIESAIALGIMAIVSALLGWVVAGRVLRPLRTITATAQQISETNLHRRLDLPGPRDELRTLADTIDGLLARLEAAFEAERRFVANASHELLTPLTTMRAALDVAAAKPHVSAQVRMLHASLRADLDQADRLVESFLVLARAQHGTLGEQTSVSLAQILGGALARRRGAIAAKQIALDGSIAPAYVEGSQTLLARMVDNLIDNAVRHNVPRGFINVRCEADQGTARLVVESGGVVLDRTTVDQLAQPFRRLGAERTGSENGHGVGLSIVAAVAAAHGGELRLYAREQGGLGTEITLPAAAEAPPATGEAPPVTGEAPPVTAEARPAAGLA